MSTNLLFEITFLLAAPFWGLMILAPNWSATVRIMGSPWSATAPLLVYLALAIPEFGTLWAVVSVPDLTTLRAFAGSAAGATALWAHVIAFDLFVGRWIHHDARTRGVRHVLVAPILVLTILLSPLGLLSYLLVRAVHGHGAARRLRAREREQPYSTH